MPPYEPDPEFLVVASGHRGPQEGVALSYRNQGALGGEPLQLLLFAREEPLHVLRITCVTPR